MLILKNTVELAKLLRVSPSFLIRILELPDKDRYETFQIYKKNGNKRNIAAPIPQLKIIQDKLKIILEQEYHPKYCVFGFIKNRDIIQNAERHINSDIVLNIDLKNFFQSITFSRIKGLFKAKSFTISNSVADSLANICCFDNCLPQGAPTSPIISNMIAKRLDRELLEFAQKNKCTYSRYVDDITFSTEDIRVFEKNVVVLRENKYYDISDELKSIIQSNGFNINTKKIHYKTKQSRQTVTGLVVNKFVNTNRQYVKNLRLMLFRLNKSLVYNGLHIFAYKFNNWYKKEYKNRKKYAEYIKVIEGKLNFLCDVKGCNNQTYLYYAKEMLKVHPQYKKNLLNKHVLKTGIWRIEVCEMKNREQLVVAEAHCFNLGDYGFISSYHLIKQYLEDIQCNIKFLKIKKVGFDEQTSYNIYIDYDKSSIEKDILVLKPPHVYNHDDNLERVGNSYSFCVGAKIFICTYSNNIDLFLHKNEGKISGFDSSLGYSRYKTDLHIYEGMSGAPVFNEYNKVIGIVFKGAAKTDINNPVDTVETSFVPINLLI